MFWIFRYLGEGLLYCLSVDWEMHWETWYDGVCMCECVHVPAICKEELEVSHVDLPQRNTVALCQRQGDSVHAVIQRPEHKTVTQAETNKSSGFLLLKQSGQLLSFMSLFCKTVQPNISTVFQ